MALLFCDSFDHYSNAQLTRKWPAAAGSFIGSVGPSSSYGRNGTSGVRVFANAANDSYLRRSFAANMTTVIMGAGVKMVTGGGILFAVLDNGTLQCELRTQSDGSLKVTRNGTLLGSVSAPGLLDASTFRSVQWKVTISDTVGVAEVKVDNITVITLTSQDTKNTANAYITQYQLGEVYTAGTYDHYIDDFWIVDTTGGVNDTYLGDQRVQCCFPAAEGDQADYTPSTGTNNAALVDETPANDDTDYVESSTVGNIDLYTITVSPSIPTAATVAGVQVCTTDKKTDSGTRTARHKIRYGAGPTTANGADYAPGTAYSINCTPFNNQPTPAEVNAPMQIGSEVRS